MSEILSCVANSATPSPPTPDQIIITWQGDYKPDGALVDWKCSIASPTVGAPLSLGGWNWAGGTPPPVTGPDADGNYTFTGTMEPSKGSSLLQPGALLQINFAITPKKGRDYVLASVVVDATVQVTPLTGSQALTGFPFEVAGLSGNGAAPSGGLGASAPAGNAISLVDQQVRAVLGRTPSNGGVAATLAALDRCFQPVLQDGINTYAWNPQSYAVQSDIGAGVTGKQASIARLAASVGDEILPLVNGLTPLVPETAVNPDEIAAAQSIFNDTWPAFVSELATDGAPRVTRARGLLSDAVSQVESLGILLGVITSQTIGGVTKPVATLSDLTNFSALNPGSWGTPQRANVVTPADEENYTNFIIAGDRLTVLVQQFASVYGTQLPDDRGTLVVLLQRSTDAVGEEARNLFDTLDSVYLGEDEREVIFVDQSAELSVEDVVSWAAGFPAQEAAPLLQDGGTLGAQIVHERATQILYAVQQLSVRTNSPPSGLAHPRVQVAIGQLQAALQSVQTYAQDVANNT